MLLILSIILLLLSMFLYYKKTQLFILFQKNSSKSTYNPFARFALGYAILGVIGIVLTLLNVSLVLQLIYIFCILLFSTITSLKIAKL